MKDENKVVTNRRRRLARLIREKFDTQARFIAATGQNQGEISGLLKSKSFGEKKARAIERDCRIPAGWLDLPDDESASTLPSPPPLAASEVLIPQYATGGSMGNGVLLRDQPGEIQSWQVTKEWATKNIPNNSGLKNLCIVTGFGPSMRPLFNPGDPLLVDLGVTKPDTDAIYFFRVGEEGFIKHLQRVPGVGILAISENKRYRDWAITEEMDFEVFGRVLKVWCGTEF